MYRRLAHCGITVRRKPLRVGFDPHVPTVALDRHFAGRPVSRRQVLAINVASGLLIAVSVFLLGRTEFLDRGVDFCVVIFLKLKLLMIHQRFTTTSCLPTLISLLAVVSLAATACSYIKSIRATVLANLGIAGAVAALNILGLIPLSVPFSAVPVILLITLGAALDDALRQRAMRRHSKNISERQQAGSVIVRHINHCLNPTIRAALSPILAVKAVLQQRDMLDNVIARRRDGNDERVGDALETAVVSLRQIGDVLETTEDLFAGRIEEQEFVEVDLAGLFEREIIPGFGNTRFTIRADVGSVGTIRLHRPSFVQAMKNLIRNAEVHGFPSGFSREDGLLVTFSGRCIGREIVIDYTNNGLPFPKGFRTTDFLAFGRKGRNSPGKGLGGAWVAKFIELHNGTFRKVGNDPVHFRITLPRRLSR